LSDADIIIMMHPNSPFLQASTIQECVNEVVTGEHDSAFTAYEYKKLTWFNGKPLNYILDEATPHLSQLPPVIFEQSALYVFSRSSYLTHHNRIGSNPFVKIINHFEGHEVNELEDYEIAELIVSSGMYSGF
jgi:CMP-N-acetylneuraminic acid synthetase